MFKILSFHSFRRGTGKTNITANVASIYAMQGKRVGVIDTSMQAPAMHILFGLDETKIKYSLNDYLWGKCKLEQTVHDVTTHLQPGLDLAGQVFLIPASSKLGDITQVLRHGFEISRLNETFSELISLLDLEILFIDTYAGLSETTLLSIAVSDATFIILRLDEQSYHGTGIMIGLAREFNVSNIGLILNEVPHFFDLAEVTKQVEESYNCPVAVVLPYNQELMALSSTSIFALQFPEDPLTKIFEKLAQSILETNE
jgi:MinD-like ATPase involved in chromosome partitioning or flagellar assembly